jgi:hypothetical protein
LTLIAEYEFIRGRLIGPADNRKDHPMPLTNPPQSSPPFSRRACSPSPSRRSNFATIFALTLLIVAGCVPSLHEMYTDHDSIFDPALVGTFSSKDSTWTFSKHDESSYDLVLLDKDAKATKFLVHLVKVPDGTMFLDVFPADDPTNPNFIPNHSFMLVYQISPTLKLANLDPDWTKKYLADHPDALAHEKVKDDIVLTAAPADVQKFLAANAKTDGAFSSGDDLIRQVPATAPAGK